jgi:DNA-binding FadR family transcriptional regulator
MGPRNQPTLVEQRSRKLYELLADELARDIVSGRVAPEETLAAEQELAERFGVSKPVVRAAIQELGSAGLVRIRHGKRTIVTERHEWDVLRGMVQTAMREEGRTSQLVRDLYQMRQVIEPQAAAWATALATESELEHLQDIVHRMAATPAGGDPVAAFLEADEEFHMAIARASQNLFLGAMLQALRGVIATSWAESQTEERDLETLRAQHTAIAEAIVRRDETAAADAMRRHIIWALERELTPASEA